MNAVTHILPDELLMAHACGALPEAFELVVASHVELSDEARAGLATFEAVGGALLESGPSVEMGEGSFDALLKRLTAPQADAIEVARPETQAGIFPAPLRDHLGGDIETVRWRSLGMGARQAILQTNGAAKVRLLYIPSGMSMPDHGHGGTEITLVLQGAYRDDRAEFRRGDVEVADQTMEHRPVAFGDEDCICLSATDARLRFRALLPRLAQPFLRI